MTLQAEAKAVMALGFVFLLIWCGVLISATFSPF